MDLIVLDCLLAKRFVPDKPSAVMRIYSRNPDENILYGDLKESKLWVAKFNYVFDDLPHLTPEQSDRLSKSDEDENLEYAYLSRELAGEIVYNFRSVRSEIECLVVHCKAGMSRSPAVAMALNYVFKLGRDTFTMSKEFPDFNETVYKMVRDAGLELIGQTLN